MDPPMSRATLALVVIAVVAALGALAPAALGSAVPAAAGSSPPLAGNVSGPGFVATSGTASFYLNASGGPAGPLGAIIGTISWNATLSGGNLTGSSVSPSTGTITNATSQPVTMTVTTGAVVETLKLTVKLTSTGLSGNKTTDVSTSFRIVTPYVVRATLVAGANAAVLPFNVTVALDGAVVGAMTVPKLSPNETYDLVYRYASGGLSSGDHTFTLAIADPHGLVTFSNGLTVETTTFYVAPAPTSDTVWYVIGAVAFFGVLFIYATRVAARRQGSARR